MVESSDKSALTGIGRASAAGSALLSRLDQAVDRYPGALARAAQYIVENPEKVVFQSLAELSDYSEVGQASVMRLCQKLGFDGFTDFKLALSADLALRDTRSPGSEGKLDPLSRIAGLLCGSINETRALLEEPRLRRVANRLTASIRIDLFGAGVSGIIGELISYRLLRLGYHATAMRDPVLAHEVSSGLGPEAAVIAVSQSGTTPDTVKFLKHARDAGAFTVALTCHPKSALARAASETLVMARLHEPTYGSPITDVPRSVLVAEALALALSKRPDGE
ncbi:MAG: MurR/RpiR family transcriptional regulator [Kiloniellales bacterium]|nr:MurR/RpiR family transcriptional regulator [Kiloniellales bacterium]